MSQIASFYLLKDGQRQELSNGDCSGVVYMAIWDWCESELDLDVRFPAPQTEDTLDCAPIWNWCGATLPCCMKCYKAEGYHAGKAV